MAIVGETVRVTVGTEADEIMALPKALETETLESVTVTAPAAALEASVAVTFATVPLAIVVVLTPAMTQFTWVTPDVPGATVEHVAVFAAAVATAPAVTVKADTTEAGAEIENPSAEGCNLVVLVWIAKLTLPPGKPDRPLDGKLIETVDAGNSVKVRVAVSAWPLMVAVPVTVSVLWAMQAPAARLKITIA